MGHEPIKLGFWATLCNRMSVC